MLFHTHTHAKIKKISGINLVDNFFSDILIPGTTYNSNADKLHN